MNKHDVKVLLWC